jgi:hypothetical protein
MEPDIMAMYCAGRHLSCTTETQIVTVEGHGSAVGRLVQFDSDDAL